MRPPENSSGHRDDSLTLRADACACLTVLVRISEAGVQPESAHDARDLLQLVERGRRAVANAREFGANLGHCGGRQPD
jgi:hypothetical protein